jgi:Universal stress protein family
MRVFRRSRTEGFEAMGTLDSRPGQVGSVGQTGGLPRHDTGSVVVGLDDRHDGRNALEWAAAEAAARQTRLRIVYAMGWPPFGLDAFGGVSVNQWDAGTQEGAEYLAVDAASRAQAIAPGLQVTTRIGWGGPRPTCCGRRAGTH